jgi:hypothetical protein
MHPPVVKDRWHHDPICSKSVTNRSFRFDFLAARPGLFKLYPDLQVLESSPDDFDSVILPQPFVQEFQIISALPIPTLTFTF